MLLKIDTRHKFDRTGTPTQMEVLLVRKGHRDVSAAGLPFICVSLCPFLIFHVLSANLAHCLQWHVNVGKLWKEEGRKCIVHKTVWMRKQKRCVFLVYLELIIAF